MTVSSRQAVGRDRPDVPGWALAGAFVLCLAFAGLVVFVVVHLVMVVVSGFRRQVKAITWGA